MTTSPDSSTINIGTKARKKRKILKYCLVTIALVILLLLFWLIYAAMPASLNVKMIWCYDNIYKLHYKIGEYQRYYDGKYPQYQSEDGTQLWSWRFVREDPTCQYPDPNNRFHRDEPWNSERNLQAIEQSHVDSMFICPCCRSKDKRATYVAVTGPGTAWTEISNGNVKYPRETCRDMILFIETTEPKNHWAEPGDDVSPEEVIRLFQADPGLVKNSKQLFIFQGPYHSSRYIKDSPHAYFCKEGHWPKFFATVGGSCDLFSEIKSVEELRKRLYVPEEFLINKPEPSPKR